MLDPWLYAALIITPIILVIIVLVAKHERLLRIADTCANLINRLILSPLNRALLQPLERREQEKRKKQRDTNLALWQARQTEETLLTRDQIHSRKSR